MKRSSAFIAFFAALVLFSGCAQINAQNPGADWTTYHAANDTLVNPNFPSYSFEYPTYWKMEEGINHIALVSKAKLLKDVPEKLKPGQILVGLSLNINMAPEEMVTGYTSTLDDIIQFNDVVAIRLNGRPAVYQEGIHRETGDESLMIAVDMGNNTRGLITSRMPEGELEKWQEILFKMAGSLKIEE